MTQTMQNKYENHRVWHFIQQAKENGRNAIDFFHPVSALANKRYTEISELLNQKGYIATTISNPQGVSLVGIMRISNIQGV